MILIRTSLPWWDFNFFQKVYMLVYECCYHRSWWKRLQRLNYGKPKLPQSKKISVSNFFFLNSPWRPNEAAMVTKELKQALTSRHIRCEECEGTYPLAEHSSICSNPLYSSPPTFSNHQVFLITITNDLKSRNIRVVDRIDTNHAVTEVIEIPSAGCRITWNINDPWRFKLEQKLDQLHVHTRSIGIC